MPVMPLPGRASTIRKLLYKPSPSSQSHLQTISNSTTTNSKSPPWNHYHPFSTIAPPPKRERNEPNNDEYPPSPIPNRPLRDQKQPQSPSFTPSPHFKSPPPKSSHFDSNPSSSGESFLEKFKLFNKEEENPSPPNQSPSTPETPLETSPEDAGEIFKKMKENGLIPNAVAMLDGLCKDGLVSEAMKVFGLMRKKGPFKKKKRKKGTIPDVVIYTAVVEGFCKALKFDDAKRTFRKMQSNGIIPNSFSYTVLIQGLCRGKRLEEAVEFCVEMLEAGHSPNVASFANLVDGFCREKGVEEAKSTIESLRKKGFFLNEKAVREHLDKKGPFSPLAWEAIFGKKIPQKPF